VEEDMQAVVEEISSTKKRLRIQVPEAVVSKEMGDLFRDLGMNARIAGFRPGKVPQKVLEKRFGKEVRAQVIEKLVPDYYERAVRDNNLYPVSHPEFETKFEIRPGEPLDMVLTVEVRPEVKALNYEGIALDSISVEPSEEEIDRAIQSIRREHK